GRRSHTAQIIERAKARGEIPAEIDSAVVADLIASFAWRHLLTNRLDEDEATIGKAVNYVMRGIAAPAS
ncbi:TetR family transcriptional regulator, partial [Mesorhizobium sp. M7A.F.Ca.CA.001.16.1.1]